MRLIDADAFDERVRIAVGFSEEDVSEDFKDGVSTALLLLKTQPTVNADHVVRCVDCKWFDISEPSGTVEPIGFRCKHGRRFVEADNFCKYGERREVSGDGVLRV